MISTGYNCDICNYTTNKMSHYKNHIMSIKHIKIQKELDDQDKMQIDNGIKHMVKNNDIKSMNTVILLQKQIINIQDKLIDDKDIIIEKQESELVTTKKQIKKKDRQIRNLLSLLTDKYPDAHLLEKISDLSFIEDDQ